jgi:hypothetical protein
MKKPKTLPVEAAEVIRYVSERVDQAGVMSSLDLTPTRYEMLMADPSQMMRGEVGAFAKLCSSCGLKLSAEDLVLRYNFGFNALTFTDVMLVTGASEVVVKVGRKAVSFKMVRKTKT